MSKRFGARICSSLRIVGYLIWETGIKHPISRKCTLLGKNNLLDPALPETLQAAILARNALLHQAETTSEQATASLITLQRILELLLGRQVAPLWFPQERSW